MIHYTEDPLLNGDKENIYACLVRPKKDFCGKKFAMRTPSINLSNKQEIILKIEEKFGDLHKGFLVFLKSLEKYLGINYASIYKAKYRFLQNFKKGCLNIVFLRILALELGSEMEKYDGTLFLKLCLEKNSIRIGKLALPIQPYERVATYLSGALAGDGHLDKRGTAIVLVDGQTKKQDLHYSKKFLLSLNNLLLESFGISGTIKEKISWYALLIHNKWLARYFNYYFSIPYGKKSSKITLSEKIPNHLQDEFWRGVMDTDGSVRKSAKKLSLKSSSLTLISQFQHFCTEKDISVKVERVKRGWTLNIMSEDYLKFAKSVGFFHPKKQAIFLAHLRDGPKYVVLNSLHEDFIDLFDLFSILRPSRNSVYIKLDKYKRKSNPEAIFQLLSTIQETFGVKITECQRNRYSNHFYIHSKKFTDFVKENATYALPWQPLNSKKEKALLVKWRL